MDSRYPGFFLDNILWREQGQIGIKGGNGYFGNADFPQSVYILSA